jgi:hypothetical protein
MKAILEFDLDEERFRFEDAVNGTKWHCLVSELDNELRAKVKYPSDDIHEEAINALIKFRQFLHYQLREDELFL